LLIGGQSLVRHAIPLDRIGSNVHFYRERRVRDLAEIKSFLGELDAKHHGPDRLLHGLRCGSGLRINRRLKWSLGRRKFGIDFRL